MHGFLRRALPATTVGLGLFLLHPAPAFAVDSVTGLSPVAGPVGTTVTVTGQNMSDATTVSFNGVSTAPTSVAPDGSSLTVVVPSGAASGPVTVNDKTGPAFTVSRPTTLTLTAPARVTYPTRITFTARLTASDGTPVAGQWVVLYGRAYGNSSWVEVWRAPTGADGSAALMHTTSRLTTYVARYAGSAAWLPAASAGSVVHVVPRLTLSVPPLAKTLTATVVRGAIAPAMSGAAVTLQHYYAGAWHSEKATRTDAHGNYAFTLAWARTGDATYRTYRAADAAYDLAISALGKVTVVDRDLRAGMQGPDVLALQRRLAALRYDVGAQNGYFGYDTSHAVVAFQKVNGLPRDGVVGAAVRTRLARPVVPRLLHPLAGKAMEVDLTKQVVLVAENGSIIRVLDASTGSGQWFTEPDGSRQIAHTPLGHWAIVRKVDAMVNAPLGQLYRPAYFNWDGYAIHGNGSVPPYPASHGCVRITDPGMDRLFTWIALGTSVWIYRS